MAAPSKAISERAEAFAAALARDLDRCAAIYTVMARELAAAYDISALPPQDGSNLMVFGPLVLLASSTLKRAAAKSRLATGCAKRLMASQAGS